jgi:hypothetical protein
MKVYFKKWSFLYINVDANLLTRILKNELEVDFSNSNLDICGLM